MKDDRLLGDYHASTWSGNGDSAEWEEMEAMVADASGRAMRQRVGGPEVNNSFRYQPGARERIWCRDFERAFDGD